jgi:ATP-binding cassette subfamily B protein
MNNCISKEGIPIDPASTIAHSLMRLWLYLDSRSKKHLLVLLVFMLLSSLAEFISVGAIAPFLVAITNPNQAFKSDFGRVLGEFLGLNNASAIILPLALFFGISSLVSGLLRLLVLWFSTRLSFEVGGKIGVDIYRRALYQPYSDHISENSSELISAITLNVERIIHQVINPLLVSLSSIFLLLAVLSTLLLLEPLLTCMLVGSMGSIYFMLTLFNKRKLDLYSVFIPKKAADLVRLLQEGFGGIRDVLIDGTQDFYCRLYVDSDLALRKAQASIQFIGSCPRYLMESLGMMLIAVLAYLYAGNANEVSNVIPALGLLALGIQRILPVAQQFYNAWTNLRGSQGTLVNVLSRLEKQLPPLNSLDASKPLEFKSSFAFDSVYFRYYPQQSWLLKEINLEIPKGSKIGFIGLTGSGKTTLLDILMGLLSPTKGFLKVDGVSIDLNYRRGWQKHIAHVPQSIYLADTSILENIAFGVPRIEIDIDRVRLAAEKACIAQDIESWTLGYDTFVGERGVKLSGGQRQRIGIARAFYKKADVIVLDEATSALDNQTEASVMASIQSLNPEITVIIIAHRLSSLSGCDKIIELSAGRIGWVGSYNQLNIKNQQNEQGN